MKNWVVAVVVMVVGLAVAATFFFMRSSVVHLVEPGDSMNPTSHRGDDMTVVDVAEVHRGDIIVFDPTGWPDRDEFQGFLVKRVIGVGGDVIVSTSTQLKVNGKTIAEGYTQRTPTRPNSTTTPSPCRRGRCSWPVTTGPTPSTPGCSATVVASHRTT
ncbi:hypothetical protein GCM10029964_105180 [Kibdelosporangium lantanae]